MITFDRDIITKLIEGDEQIIGHVEGYSGEEWTIPALVAWESYESYDSRTEMVRARNKLQSEFDRIIDFSDDVALEAAYLDERLQLQGVSLDTVDLLNLATAYEDGGKFVTHNKRDFDKGPLHDLADVDVLYTE